LRTAEARLGVPKGDKCRSFDWFAFGKLAQDDYREGVAGSGGNSFAQFLFGFERIGYVERIGFGEAKQAVQIGA